MGIGNTTSAAALVCALTGHPPELVCGRGTGVDDAGLALKIKTVKAALEKNQDLIKTGDPNTILRAVGKSYREKMKRRKTANNEN